ncbi:MAG: hypothetical protein EA001_03145 [Oscillatoriales cyanobacterium]|nr:MAG: hypothetical protein EA001_03145 [Oscillatoriales cyanobacterium]
MLKIDGYDLRECLKRISCLGQALIVAERQGAEEVSSFPRISLKSSIFDVSMVVIPISITHATNPALKPLSDKSLE